MPADAPPRPVDRTPGLRLDDRQLPWTSRLARDYSHAFAPLAPFFAGPPAPPAGWTDALTARRRQRPDPAAADVLAQQLEARGAPAAACAAARRLRDAQAVAVVTGQQAGLFGGPLFTLLKAITAIRLAREAAAAHDADVVPVFWIDAEDHDLDEIRTCHVLNRDLAVEPIALALSAPPGAAAAAVTLDPAVTDTLDALRRALAPTEFTDDVLAALAAAYAPGVRLVDAFARWLDHLCGPHGLVVFDASDPAAKPFVQPVFRRELEHAGRTARLAAEAGAALTALGYHAQASASADTVALFRLDGAREPIRTVNGRFAAGARTIDAAALLREVDADPARFSPNVLLRPIVQDTLLPTAACVAGPNELAYLGQLRQVYAAFDVPMPVIVPRASATLVDAATVRFLTRYDIEFAHLRPRDDAALNRLLAARLPPAIEDGLTAAAQAITERLDAVRGAVPALDPTLAGAVTSTAGRIDRDLRALRGKVIAAAKRQDATVRRQFERARTQSFPGGDLQERRLAGIHFLNRYGPALIDRLIETLPIDPGHHWLLTV